MDNSGDVFNGAGYVHILSAVTRGNALLAALVLSAIVACSDPKAGTLPSVSPTPNPTTGTASASASDYPSELRDAVARYYKALTEAANDPAHKTDALAALIAPTCTCREVLRVLRGEAAKGYRLDYSYSARNVRVIEAGSLGGNATYEVVQSPGRRLDSSGKVLARYPGSRQKFSAHFARTADGWILDRANQVT